MFADTSTILQLVTLKMVFLLEPRSNHFQKIGFAPSVV
jgi:hypothetical protein